MKKRNTKTLLTSVVLVLTLSVMALLTGCGGPSTLEEYINDNNEAKQELENEFGIQVLAIQADGAVESDVKKVIEQTVQAFGHIDVLINNAMASRSGKLLIEHSKEDFALSVDTGLYATFFYMREAHPYLKESQGAIINFASGAGFSGRIGQSSYAAAKEGIRGLSRVAATEWGPDGINVNIVCPLAWTAQLEQFKSKFPEAYEKNVKTPPMGYFANPETEIGRVCVQLASPDFKYMTGETLTLQGGTGLRP